MRLSTALLLLPLAGCTSDTTVYPSLGIRPAEARGFDEPAVAPAAPAVPDPALDAAIADAGGRLDTLIKAYDADAAKAERAAGAAGVARVGSDAWIAAQTALASLGDRRAQAAALAGEVDMRARERAETDAVPYPGLDALVARAEAEAEREAAAFAALNARVPIR